MFAHTSNGLSSKTKGIFQKLLSAAKDLVNFYLDCRAFLMQKFLPQKVLGRYNTFCKLTTMLELFKFLTIYRMFYSFGNVGPNLFKKLT